MSERSLMHLAIVALVMLIAATAASQEVAPMSLPEAMAEALNQNPRLAAAAARIERAEGGVAAAKAPAEPAFKVSGAGRMQKPTQEISIQISPGLPARTVSITRTDYATVAFGVTWPLWTGGRVEAATGAARAELAATEADLQQATEQLLYEVGVTYYRAIASSAVLAEAQASLAQATEDLRTTQVRREAGTTTEADVSRAAAAHRKAEQVLFSAETASQDAEQALNTLLARPLTEPVLLIDADLDLDFPEQPNDAVAVALSTRPELLALDRRGDAARQALAQARAERNPTVAAVGQVAWQTPTDVVQDHAEFFGIEFSWPILNHPGSEAKALQARATIAEVEQTRHDLESAIAFQVAQAARRVADAEELVAAAEESLRATEDAAARAQSAYDAGTITRQQLTAAQTARDQAAAHRAQARCGVNSARLGQTRALGLVRAIFLIPAEEVDQG